MSDVNYESDLNAAIIGAIDELDYEDVPTILITIVEVPGSDDAELNLSTMALSKKGALFVLSSALDIVSGWEDDEE